MKRILNKGLHIQIKLQHASGMATRLKSKITPLMFAEMALKKLGSNLYPEGVNREAFKERPSARTEMALTRDGLQIIKVPMVSPSASQRPKSVASQYIGRVGTTAVPIRSKATQAPDVF